MQQNGTYFFIGSKTAQHKATISKGGNLQIEYGETFKKEDDIIGVVLDLEQGTLGYIINGKDYGVSHDGMDVDGEYRMFVDIS